MGQYHYLINLDKKQVIHPHHIGNGLKLQEQIGWPYATATTLVMLLAASSRDGGRGGGDFRCGHPLIGAWAGDRVALLGDYAASDDLPGLDAPLVHAQCHAACNPNLKGGRPEGWEAWTDISPQVREMMEDEFGIRYAGAGWLDILGKDKVSPALRPDVVLSASAQTNP